MHHFPDCPGICCATQLWAASKVQGSKKYRAMPGSFFSIRSILSGGQLNSPRARNRCHQINRRGSRAQLAPPSTEQKRIARRSRPPSAGLSIRADPAIHKTPSAASKAVRGSTQIPSILSGKDSDPVACTIFLPADNIHAVIRKKRAPLGSTGVRHPHLFVVGLKGWSSPALFEFPFELLPVLLTQWVFVQKSSPSPASFLHLAIVF